jgi:hypothetical protein
MELGLDPVNAILLFWGCYLVGAIMSSRRKRDDEA